MRVKLLIIGHLGGGAQTVARGPAEGQWQSSQATKRDSKLIFPLVTMATDTRNVIWKKDNTLLKLALDSVRESIFLLAALTETKHREL